MAQPRVNLIDMIMALSTALDLVCPRLVDHQKQVAYITECLAAELGLAKPVEQAAVLAAALHDVGAMSLKDRIDCLGPEVEHADRHVDLGYHLLSGFPPFAEVAQIVRFHHLAWEDGKGAESSGVPVPLASHLVHLADRIESRIDPDREILGQAGDLVRLAEEEKGAAFMPEAVDAFRRLARRESFWLDLVSPNVGRVLVDDGRTEWGGLANGELLDLAKLFSRIIDSRSRFTATHSAGVAAAAEALAAETGFSEGECLQMRVAGHLHDLGKLAVPAEVLEKPGRLTADEVAVVKAHTYHTYRILERVEGLETINVWASFHHEKLDGSGYPFHVAGEQIPLGSRILAVADVFTALAEGRPYREGMAAGDVLKNVAAEVAAGKLDRKVVSIFAANFDRIDAARVAAQKSALDEYEDIWRLSEGADPADSRPQGRPIRPARAKPRRRSRPAERFHRGGRQTKGRLSR